LFEERNKQNLIINDLQFVSLAVKDNSFCKQLLYISSF